MSEVQVQTKGGGALGVIAMLTTAVLFVLQVSGVISISWWLVFAPLLVMVGLGLLGLVLFLLFLLVVALFATRRPSTIVTPMRIRGRR